MQFLDVSRANAFTNRVTFIIPGAYSVSTETTSIKLLVACVCDDLPVSYTR